MIIYIIIYNSGFSLMLIAYELHLKRTEAYFRSNCGFMFSFSGRTAFLFFLASLSFAATIQKWWFAYFVGIGTLINSIFNCFVIYWHPAFQKGGPLDANADPTDAYQRGTPSLYANTGAVQPPSTTTEQPRPVSVQSGGGGGQQYAPPRHVPSSPSNPYSGHGASDNPFSSKDDNPFSTNIV